MDVRDKVREILKQSFNDIILLSDMPIEISRGKYDQATDKIMALLPSEERIVENLPNVLSKSDNEHYVLSTTLKKLVAKAIVKEFTT